jgi:peptidoglycan hydrolase CwlO-like protein
MYKKESIILKANEAVIKLQNEVEYLKVKIKKMIDKANETEDPIVLESKLRDAESQLEIMKEMVSLESKP